MSNNSKEENYKKEIRKKITLPTKSPTRSSKNKEYSYIPPERFYTEKEEVTLRFYQTPKALFKNPIYKGLSCFCLSLSLSAPVSSSMLFF